MYTTVPQRRDFPTPAACLETFQAGGGTLNPNAFRPLVTFTDGMSLLEFNKKPHVMVVAANAWINHSTESGASVASAIEAIALNGDYSPGLVALALEIAAMAIRPKTPPEVAITDDEYRGLVERLYLGDVGGIYTLMHERWGVSKDPARPAEKPRKTRSEWEQELGHDVLLHPSDLMPLRSGPKYVEFRGTEGSGASARLLFRLPRGELLVTGSIPAQPVI